MFLGFLIFIIDKINIGKFSFLENYEIHRNSCSPDRMEISSGMKIYHVYYVYS